jgi:hypothetical protein
MYEFFFSVPWWAPTILVIVGLAVMTRGNRRQNQRTRDIGIGVILLGVAWAVISFLVDTPKEICTKQTRVFVQSVVSKDWTTFDNLLDPDVRYAFVDGDWNMVGRERLDTAVRADIDQIGVSSASVSGLEASDNGDTVTTKFTVLSAQKATMDQMVPSSWDFDWHKSSSGRWVVSEIRCRSVANLSASEIRSTLPVK